MTTSAVPGLKGNFLLHTDVSLHVNLVKHRPKRLFFVLVVLLVACGNPALRTSGPTGETGQWSALPDSPLAARRSAHAFSLEGDLLVVGGTNAEPCPPNASCVEPAERPFSDGARYDPSTGRWTAIAEAPVPLGYGAGVVVEDRLYLLISGYGSSHPDVRRAFVAYDARSDRWSELPAPSGDDLLLAAAGTQVVAYRSTQENGVAPDLVYDPADDTWSNLPPDPLQPSFDRSMVRTDAGLVLLGIEVVAQPGSESPSFYRAALLDGTGEWQRLADSEVIGWNPMWSWSGGRVVNASIEAADGGEVGGWGRSYPAGGMLDPAANEWVDLPEVPTSPGGFTGIYAAGGRGVVAGSGWVFDAEGKTWVRLDRPSGAPDSEAAAAWVGNELFVWGGARFSEGEGEVLDDGWSWGPPW